jgi:hypothetical protein
MLLLLASLLLLLLLLLQVQAHPWCQQHNDDVDV